MTKIWHHASYFVHIFDIADLFSLEILVNPRVLHRYHCVRKVHATPIMSDGRTTMMGFIECTELHAAATCCRRSHKLCMPLQKNSQLSLFK